MVKKIIAFGFCSIVMLQCCFAANDEIRVSLNTSGGQLNDALNTMFKDTGKTWAFTENFNSLTIPAISIEDASFPIALKQILKSVGLTFTDEDGKYTIYKVTPLTQAVASQAEQKDVDTTVDISLRKKITRGMIRYEVKQAAGYPKQVVKSHVDGYEDWYYIGTIVHFQSGRVASITEDLIVSSAIVVHPLTKNKGSSSSGYLLSGRLRPQQLSSGTTTSFGSFSEFGTPPAGARLLPGGGWEFNAAPGSYILPSTSSTWQEVGSGYYPGKTSPPKPTGH